MTKDTTYVSEIGKFVKTYVQEHPKVESERKHLRETWWDTDGIDLAEQKNYHDSEVKFGSYVYFSYPMNTQPTQDNK
ncbi:MAG: hypothetical protein K0R14_1689 [Burkholderiales bacterium]|jgi:hypothetical protein|nr:hypothetical protein [Burkholderiales bacterium]